MFKSRIFFISMLTLSFVTANAVDSMQKIEVLNNAPVAMDWSAKNADNSFYVGQKVQAYARAVVIAQVIALDTLQDNLFAAIVRNSAVEVQRAISAGADVNKLKEGKTPLAWALTLGMFEAAACLLQNGAR